MSNIKYTKMKRVVIKHSNTVQVFTLGKTSNKKIASSNKEMIVQSYTYSKAQYEYVSNNLEAGEKNDFKTFFKLADSNCLDCPFSSLQLSGCYTHKMNQYSGFISQLRSIVKQYGNYDKLPVYTVETEIMLGAISKNKYVRFGTYGEPVLIPIHIVELITKVSSNWTGYSHQWNKPAYKAYNKYFMASTHTMDESLKAEALNFRSFMAAKNVPQFSNIVNCPASEESGKKSNCHKCGLCSGISGKGSKSVYILEH